MSNVKPEYKHSELTDGIINVFYHVYKTLGYGFLEKVCVNALVHELKKRGYIVAAKVSLKVYYDGVVVGDYEADVIVNDLIILEIKAVDALAPEHEAQLLNYLRATDKEVGLLLNFGPKPQVKRKIYGTARNK
ncbi:MAG: GxxExxY protein [Anaerolineales bacterium]